MWIVLAVLVLLSAILLFRSAYEKKQLSVSRYEVVSEKVPAAFDGFKLVFLSDLHGAVFGEKNEDLIRKTRELRPDLILLGGDMITLQKGGKKESRLVQDLQTLSDLLDGLVGIAPVYYADGNHERRFFDETPLYTGQKETFLNTLSAFHVPFLLNRSEAFERDGESIIISGLSLDDGYYKPFRKTPFTASLPEEKLGKRTESFQILMMHSPLYLKEMAAYGADLVLSGHFHGGTIRLPLLGGVMTPQYQFFNPFCKGEFSENSTKEIVSGGLGTHSIDLRFNNLPDIVLVTLCRRKNEH